MTTSIRRLVAAAFAVAVVLTLSMGAVVRAQDATPEASVAPYTPGTDPGTLSGSINADGSSTVGPITQAVAEEFNKLAGGVQVTVDISGTGGGFTRFCAGETDIQDASREIKDEEAAACREAGVEYYVFEVAYDGVTVVVNPENTQFDCLTVAQLNAIWKMDSTVSKWSDVDPAWSGDDIALYGPGTESGTYDFFTAQINGEEGVSTVNFTPSEDDNVLVEGVAGDKNALAYFGYAYYLENQDRLKAVAIDGGAGCVSPSPETVRDGTYAPLSRPLYVYVKKESFSRPEVQEFMRFYIANAQALVDDVGFVDSPAQIYVDDQAKVEGIIGGTVEADGPGAE